MSVTGYFIYQDTIIAQHLDVAEPFKNLFQTVKPSQILEIGTAHGGLTLLIRDLLDEVNLTDCQLTSYDVLDFPRYGLQNAINGGAKINFILKDVFNHQYSELVEVDEIVNYIQQTGTTIVLCDGGSKKNEFRIISKFLKPGDIIMAHDYAFNQEYFEANIKDKIWNWLEIQDSDIEEPSNQNGLSPFQQDNFTNVVWVCKIKN
jgi:predicted O-methyltransferase YrrM